MNSKLSTDELFHFTKIDRLISIIKDGFYPRYNLEHTFLSDLFELHSAVESIPMVCFCDIPLNMVQEHSSKYGKCAIGLDKKWGEKYGLSPVIYVHKNSSIGDAISALANSFSNFQHSEYDSDFKLSLMVSTFAKGLGQLTYFVKQYERTEDEYLCINGKPYEFKKGRFYDEREWRFVPSNSIDNFWLVQPDIIHNEDELNKANEKLKKHTLRFEIDDIKYIICETEEDKNKLINALCERFQLNNEDVLEKLTVRLIDET